MPPIQNAKRPVPRSSNSSALARNTILLLSGYLWGTTAAHVCSPMMEVYAVGTAAIGMIAYALLATRSRQKQAQDARRALETATVKLERRIEQHIRVASARLLLKLHTARQWPHEQYMTVVRSPRTVR